MRITPLVVDEAPVASHGADPDVLAFGRALDGAGAALAAADRAEDAYAVGGGSLLNAVVERAQADVMLAVATAAVGHTVQSVQTVLNMQI